MRKTLIGLAVVGLLGAAAFAVMTWPRPLPASALPNYTPDAERGLLVYTIGGCNTCHRAPEGADPASSSLPVGGHPLKTPLGTFYPPNLTPDEETGIGRWSDIDFVNAMSRGLSPSGSHYFPAFPYTSYRRMRIEDILDLRAYLASLPPVRAEDKPPDVPLTWLLRRSVGLWKLMALDGAPLEPDAGRSAAWNRGAYLVRGPGHCGECHTPRNLFMISDESRFLAGGPHPEGKDKVRSLRGLIKRGRYADADELVSAMRFGEMLGYDKLSSGGMGAVQSNLAKLPEADVKAIAEYLTSLD